VLETITRFKNWLKNVNTSVAKNVKATILMATIFAGISLLLSGCATVDPTASVTSSAGTPPSTSGSRIRISGSIATVGSNQLAVQTRTGNQNLAFSSSTAIYRVTAGTLSDITPDTCIIAKLATKASANDSVPRVTAVSVRPQTGGACPVSSGTAQTSAGTVPKDSATPNPTHKATHVTTVSGLVASMDGGTLVLNVTDSSGTTVPLTLKTTTSTAVTVITVSTPDAVITGQCVVAVGSADGSGVTVDALAISAPGPQGCASIFGGIPRTLAK